MQLCVYVGVVSSNKVPQATAAINRGSFNRGGTEKCSGCNPRQRGAIWRLTGSGVIEAGPLAMRMPDIPAGAVSRGEIHAGVERLQGQLNHFAQNTHPGAIRPDRDSMSGRAYISGLTHAHGDSSHLDHALSHDRCQRTPGGWKLTDRTYEIRHLDAIPPAGSAPHVRLAASPRPRTRPRLGGVDLMRPVRRSLGRELAGRRGNGRTSGRRVSFHDTAGLIFR
jgi:hypothetical protein